MTDTNEPRHSLLRTLSSLLVDAAEHLNLAVKAADEGKYDLAIGTILHLDSTLPAANALLTVILTLHRSILKGGVR